MFPSSLSFGIVANNHVSQNARRPFALALCTPENPTSDFKQTQISSLTSRKRTEKNQRNPNSQGTHREDKQSTSPQLFSNLSLQLPRCPGSTSLATRPLPGSTTSRRAFLPSCRPFSFWSISSFSSMSPFTSGKGLDRGAYADWRTESGRLSRTSSSDESEGGTTAWDQRERHIFGIGLIILGLVGLRRK